MFDQLADELHKDAINKGFWPPEEEVDDIFIAKQCMMIVSEVTEVMEAIRKDKGEEEITKEFADILSHIRLYNIDQPFVALASNYGVPQNRERVLFVGCRKDQKLI